MKRFLFTLCFIAAMTAPSFAISSAFNIYLDGQGGYLGQHDAGSQGAYGGNLGIGLHRNFNLVGGALLSSGSTGGTEKAGSIEMLNYNCSQTMYVGGLEYIPTFDFLSLLTRNGFFLKLSVLGGYSKMSYKLSPSPYLLTLPSTVVVSLMTLGGASGMINFSNSGATMMVKIGVNYELTQHLALFADFGFNRSMYSGNKGNVYGPAVLAGVRLSMFRTRTLEKDY